MSQTLAALDSLTAQLVPQLPAASQVALQKAANYYVIQALASDIAAVAICSVTMGVVGGLIHHANKQQYESEKSNWHLAAVIIGVVGAIIGVVALTEVASHMPLYLDPTTATIMRLLGK